MFRTLQPLGTFSIYTHWQQRFNTAITNNFALNIEKNPPWEGISRSCYQIPDVTAPLVCTGDKEMTAGGVSGGYQLSLPWSDLLVTFKLSD